VPQGDVVWEWFGSCWLMSACGIPLRELMHSAPCVLCCLLCGGHHDGVNIPFSQH